MYREDVKEARKTVEYVGVAIIILLLLILLIPLYLSEADAGIQGLPPSDPTPKIKEAYYLRGDLTSPRNDESFGGAIIGEYLITVNFDEVKIIAEFYNSPSQGMILEGWLVNSDNESHFSVGQFDKKNNMLKFYQKDIEPHTYDLFIITEKSLSDTDSSDHKSIGGAPISMKISSKRTNIGQ